MTMARFMDIDSTDDKSYSDDDLLDRGVVTGVKETGNSRDSWKSAVQYIALFRNLSKKLRHILKQGGFNF